MLNDLLVSIAFLALFFREQYFQNALDFCLRGDVFSGNSTSKMRRRFFREQYFQNVATFFSGNSTSKMRLTFVFAATFFREQYFQNAATFGVVVDFVLFTLKLKDGMIKIKKINLNEEVKLKLN